ncbi:hypothetical protein [Deinococcus sp. AJ005]|uniref:hypothetical protein n=1 Tax=Deinococcus sp. AJ005 TaxID=2652443 RepID=UPI00125CB165|nr:hypothetical protein [Deinococcus sp. AJ005]QFP77760.1 hypothetical protein DAAJ005_15855 [Deinococcus sp. AJ005]
MRRKPLLIVLALVLSGSSAFGAAILPTLPVTDADFSGALARLPVSDLLGRTPELSGKVAEWSIPSSRSSSLDRPQKTVIGTIDGAGNYSVTLPAQPPETQQVTLTQLVRGFNILEDGDCSVNTLVISAPEAVAGKLGSLYVLRDEPAGAAVGTQPPPSYTTFKAIPRYFLNAVSEALYSSVAANVKGELSCTSKYLKGKRDDLFVNIALVPGWNSVTLIYGEEQVIEGETIQKKLLRGGLVSDTP